MKVSFDNGKTWTGEGQGSVSPENAAKKLRNRISETLQKGLGLRHVKHAGWLAWRSVRTFIYWGIMVFAIAIIFWPDAGRSATAVTEVFLIGTALLLVWTYLDIRKHFNIRIFKGEQQHGILIGQSYKHFTESGNRSAVEVGEDAPRYIDYLAEPNPHVMMLGSTSSGKTTTMRSFISRVAVTDNVPFLVIDWNGENETWAKEAGATLWKVPEHFKVNLFRLNDISKEARASIAMENLAIAARLTALQATRVKTHLLKFYLEGKEPSLFELWKAVCVGKASKNNVLDQRLRAIQRVIGSEPDEFWNGIFTRNNIVSLQGLNESEKSLVSYAILQRITELFDKNPNKDAKPRLLVAMDEAWQPAKGQERYQQEKESVAERIVRLGRKYGIGILVSTQQLEDLPKVFYNSSALVMIHQHREASYHGKDILQLDAYEREYVKNAAQGEMLLLDRGYAQAGNPHSQYIKVTPLAGIETQALAGLSEPYSPTKITEQEMPIEMHDAVSEAKSLPDIQDRVESKPRSPATAKRKLTMPPNAITPPQYAGLLAVEANPKAEKNELVGYIKDRKWFTSPTTLWGSKGNPGIITDLLERGMIKEKGRGYALTDTGAAWVVPELMMANQTDKLGSEEHKQLMVKTIRMLQLQLILPIVSKEKHSFDILGIPVNEKKRGLWNIKKAKGYECQTSARKDSIGINAGKSEMWGIPTVWVADKKEVMEGIKEVQPESKYMKL